MRCARVHSQAVVWHETSCSKSTTNRGASLRACSEEKPAQITAPTGVRQAAQDLALPKAKSTAKLPGPPPAPQLKKGAGMQMTTWTITRREFARRMSKA